MQHPTPVLSDADRADRDRLIAGVHAARGREIDAQTETGRHLREISDRGLHRETHPTFVAFVKAEFRKSESWAYQRIDLADVADDLVSVDAPPPSAASHAGHLVQLRHPDPDAQAGLRSRAQALAHERASKRGRAGRPTEGDVEAACAEVRAEAAAAARGGGEEGADAPSHSTGLSAEREAERTAVREHPGLVVAVGAAGEHDPATVLARLPGLALVPYDDGLTWPEDSSRAACAPPFVRAELDPIARLTWPVLAPDPWEAPAAWSLPSDDHADEDSGRPPRAVFYPERLASPRGRVAREATDRDRSVLVAPGVDLFDGVPDRVARAVVEAAGADPHRRYLLLTRHPGRAWTEGWPQNVWVVVEASGSANAVEAALQTTQGESRALAAPRMPSVPRALLVRDLAEPVSAGVLAPVGWALVRGRRTTQVAYDSVRRGVGTDWTDLGPEVKARHSAYPALPTTETPTKDPTTSRPPAKGAARAPVLPPSAPTLSPAAAA